MPIPSSRRRFLLGLVPTAALAAGGEGRELDFAIDPAGFGEAGVEDIRAVVRSAAAAIWRHCPGTRFRNGFRIYHHDRWPITHFEPAPDGRIVIGLAVEGRLWARFTFQFAHEFGHALMDHSNDGAKLWREDTHANQWFEESLCEVASLFALRAMAKTWATEPPYPNWRDYAPHLADYARQRMDDPKHRLPEGASFRKWFSGAEAVQRTKWTRENNCIVARELLPLFERNPEGWDALRSLNLCVRDPAMPLARFLGEWSRNADAGQRAFVGRVAAVFGPG